MSRCAALGCSSYANDVGISFFSIPIKPRVKSTWERNIGRNDLPLSSLICQKHFTSVDFDNDLDHNGKLRLKPSAIPSMFGSMVTKEQLSPMRRSNRHRRPKKQLEEYLSTKKKTKTLDMKFSRKQGNKMGKQIRERSNEEPSIKLDSPSPSQSKRNVLNESDFRGEAIADWYLTDIFEATKYIINALPNGSVVTEELISGLEETIIDIISKLIHRISSVIITSFEEEFGKCSQIMKGLKKVFYKTSEQLQIMKKQDIECNNKEEVDADEAMFEQMLKGLDPEHRENPVLEEVVSPVFASDEMVFEHTYSRTPVSSKKPLKGKKVQSPQLFCSKCDFKTQLKSHLKKHVLKHLFAKRYDCSKCDYKCSSSGSMKKHLRTHSGSKPFGCSLCDFRTANSSNLIRHRSIHRRQKSIPADRRLENVYICYDCFDVFTTRSKLKDHLKSRCAEKRRSDDANCSVKERRDKRENFENRLNSKMKGAHLVGTTSSSTNQHSLENQSSFEEPVQDSSTFRCDKCDYMTDKASCFSQHEISHFDEKWLECNLCEKTFRLNFNLRTHLREVHGYKKV